MRKVLVLAVVALGALGLGVSNALAKDLVVDKDKVQCPKAGFTSIQAAVTAASPGDKIKVCPDTYTESVSVPKTLVIVASPTTKLDNQAACFTEPPAAPDPTKDAIVDGGAFSFDLMANDIRLEGFVIQGAEFGVQTSSSFSGYTITGNLVQDNGLVVRNTGGINLLSNGAKQSRVTMNCVRRNQEGVLSVIGPLLVNARIDHNAGTRNERAFDASGVGSRDRVSFDHNTTFANNRGILISNSTNSSIKNNSSTGDGGGVSVGGSNSGLAVENNTVTGALFSGMIISSSTNTFPEFTGPNTGLSFDHNNVSESSRGIFIRFDARLIDSTIDHNNTFANGLFGILLEAGSGTGNTIARNKADANLGTGIYSQGATGNTFLQNSMFGNGVVDARDDNRPSNTWSGNQCDTDFPPGTICGV